VIECTVKNVDAIVRAIETLKKSLVASITQGMQSGMVKFGGEIERRQLRMQKSARHPEMGLEHVAYGLYSWHGQAGLRGSWRVRPTGPGAVEYFFASKYARIHQYGGTINWPGTANGWGRGIKIPPHQIRIPKRLFVMEEYDQYGKSMVFAGVNEQIDRLFSKL
jgi:hypothetical protein